MSDANTTAIEPTQIYIPDQNIQYLPTPIPNVLLSSIKDTLIQPDAVATIETPTTDVNILSVYTPPTPSPVPVPTSALITVSVASSAGVSVPVAVPTPIPTSVSPSTIAPLSIGSDIIGVFPPVSTTSTSVPTQAPPSPPQPIAWSPNPPNPVHLLPVLQVPPIIDTSSSKLVGDWTNTPSISGLNTSGITTQTGVALLDQFRDTYVLPSTPAAAITIAIPQMLVAAESAPAGPPAVWDSEIAGPPLFPYQTDFHFSDGGAV